MEGGSIKNISSNYINYSRWILFIATVLLILGLVLPVLRYVGGTYYLWSSYFSGSLLFVVLSIVVFLVELRALWKADGKSIYCGGTKKCFEKFRKIFFMTGISTIGIVQYATPILYSMWWLNLPYLYGVYSAQFGAYVLFFGYLLSFVFSVVMWWLIMSNFSSSFRLLFLGMIVLSLFAGGISIITQYIYLSNRYIYYFESSIFISSFWVLEMVLAIPFTMGVFYIAFYDKLAAKIGLFLLVAFSIFGWWSSYICGLEGIQNDIFSGFLLGLPIGFGMFFIFNHFITKKINFMLYSDDINELWDKGSYNELLRVYEKLKMKKEYMHLRRVMDAKGYEKARNYEAAAKMYEELGMYEDAGRCRELMKRETVSEGVRFGHVGPRVAGAAAAGGIKAGQVRDIYGIEKGSARHSWGDFSVYEIEGKIGSGGFSEVYLVEREGKKYAMKIPKGVDMMGGETLELSKGDVGQYGKEAEIWAMLTEHVPEGVINLVDAGIQPFPWFVMELAEGSLRGVKEGMNYEDNLRLAIDLLGKLDKIHHFGVVHKDIKPENILYAGGEWKFTDFGLSKIISKSSKSSQMVSGTLMYMAPEQISKKGFGHTDWRTDIWQMGVMIYELLTGHIPFEGDGAGEIMGAIVNDDPEPGTKYGLSEGVWRVLERALRKDKEQRWQSAAEMRRALEGLR